MATRKDWSFRLMVKLNWMAFIFGLVVLGLSSQLLILQQKISFLSTFPKVPAYIGIGLGVAIAVISILGVIGVMAKNVLATTLFMLIDGALMLGIIVGMVLVFLASNNTTIPGLSQPIAQLESSIQKAILSQAISNTTSWQTTQETFKCCGVDFNSTYLYDQFNETDAAFVDALQPGAACASGRTAILSLHATYPNASLVASEHATANTALSSYFCVDKAISFVNSNTLIVGVIFAAIVLIQFVTVIASHRLLYYVSKADGGFVTVDPETGGKLSFDANDQNGKPRTNQVAVGAQLA